VCVCGDCIHTSLVGLQYGVGIMLVFLFPDVYSVNNMSLNLIKSSWAYPYTSYTQVLVYAHDGGGRHIITGMVSTSSTTPTVVHMPHATMYYIVTIPD
jgi:hypothetical protein